MVDERRCGAAALLAVALLFITGVVPVTANPTPLTTPPENATVEAPPQAGSAALWSRDVDGSARQNGSSNSTLDTLARLTDITYTEPPSTAAAWSATAFDRLPSGDRDTSVAPPHADRTDGHFIRDAHTTSYGVHPATNLHRSPDQVVRYIAPNGTLRALIDYRVRVPDPDRTGDTTRTWRVKESSIGRIQLRAGNTVIARENGTHTPVLSYESVPTTDTLALRATIHVELEERVRQERIRCPEPNSTADCEETVDIYIRTHEESIDVEDTLAVTVYDPNPRASFIRYPDGDLGIGISPAVPWNAIEATGAEPGAVQGIWRYYTARDPNWDTLVRHSSKGATAVSNDRPPLSVHGYPAAPMSSADDGSLAISRTDGATLAPPNDTVGSTVQVGVIAIPYRLQEWIALRTGSTDGVRIAGIVDGESRARIAPDSEDIREFGRVDLDMSVLRQNATAAVVRIQLRDAETGAPIVVTAGPHSQDHPGQAATLELDGTPISVNESGVTIIVIPNPGAHTVTFQPAPWSASGTAYLPASATVRWHPLWQADTWTRLLQLGGGSIMVLIVLYPPHRTLTPSPVDRRWW